MEKGLCIECNEKPIAIKKSSLCINCYQRKRLHSLSPKIKTQEFSTKLSNAHKREVEFIKNYFTHTDWAYEPALFYLNGYRYTPDFYDRKENSFIEVCGSRQAYHANKDKYELFYKYFPALKLEIRTEDGGLLIEKKHGEKWKDQ